MSRKYLDHNDYYDLKVCIFIEVDVLWTRKQQMLSPPSYPHVSIMLKFEDYGK